MEQTYHPHIMGDMTVAYNGYFYKWKSFIETWKTKTDPCYRVCFYHFYGGR